MTLHTATDISLGIAVAIRLRDDCYGLPLSSLACCTAARQALRVSRPIGRLGGVGVGVELGLLYVMEGSSRGGKFVGTAMVDAIGAVANLFSLAHGRSHLAPSRAALATLAFSETVGLHVDGAKTEFLAFGDTVSSIGEVAA